MKISNWIIAAGAGSAIFISGCCNTCGRSPTQMASNLINRESVTQITHQNYPVKSPQTIALYTKESSPRAAYRVIGIAKVSKRNLLGLERKDETVHSMMKNLAASIGGDGLIDIDHTNDAIEGKVIAYQKILL